MRTDLGGLRRDPLRQERAPLDRESKRGIASGVRGVQPLCGYPVARIHQTGAQNIVGAFATITMDVTTFDNDGIADLANDQLVVKFPGPYLLVGHVKFAAVTTPAAGDTRAARFLVNGVGVGESGGWRAADGHQVRVQCHEVVNLARGGTIKLQGFATAAGILTIVADNNPFLAAYWLGWPT